MSANTMSATCYTILLRHVTEYTCPGIDAPVRWQVGPMVQRDALYQARIDIGRIVRRIADNPLGVRVWLASVA